DIDGRLAAAGNADEAKVAAMLKEPFFHKPPPKSLERTMFADGFLHKHFGTIRERQLPDVVATLNLFTAASIKLALTLGPTRLKNLGELVVSGGGALNPPLMKTLRTSVAPTPVVSSSTHGFPPMAKEAACFAWMALRALQGKTNNCPCEARRFLGHRR